MLPLEDLAASFRRAVVVSLTEKTLLAAEDIQAPAIALAGGVSANRLLRREMEALSQSKGIPLYLPSLELCTDNAAMIGSCAYYDLRKGKLADLRLNAEPALRLL
ncbi:MAG: tRNA (adenosine(37)-N6)-threonylcarbamoyltransferase complex transferase subunit TsaD, partial [Clostridiales bacterium]|nr:tRNA (adenosine(37)-N6)-threonylcarbamoyltransferase complex transferase subunit TsaD [Clostridiales bacterium]